MHKSSYNYFYPLNFPERNLLKREFCTKLVWLNYRRYPYWCFSNSGNEKDVALSGMLYCASFKFIDNHHGNYSRRWAALHTRRKGLWKLLGPLWKKRWSPLLCPWFLLTRLLSEQHLAFNIFELISLPLYQTYIF